MSSSIVKLASVPTLRQAYAAGLPAATNTTRFGHHARALDVISMWQGDITKLEADAIVNAANRSLLGGGGVDGAIHRAAGRKLLEECETLDGAETGEAKMTKGYSLPAKHVIHAVGPIYHRSDAEECAEQLASCYRTSYDLAVGAGLRSIGFCSISTGIYGYPIVDATRVALEVTRSFLDSSNGEKIDRIVFVVFSNKDKSVYEDLLPEYFPPDPAEETPAPGSTEPGPDSAEATRGTDVPASKSVEEPVLKGHAEPVAGTAAEPEPQSAEKPLTPSL